MSKIGLIDVDKTKFPNLALMKISSYHKRNGDHVEWWNGLLHYDRVYMAKVFDDTYSKGMPFCINADEIIKGGTGYDLQNRLPEEIEHIYPDYSLYQTPNAYGFLTRGCPRACPFCIVSEKEGRRSHQVAELSEFYHNEKKIVLLDPNITASKECEKLFDDLIKTKALCVYVLTNYNTSFEEDHERVIKLRELGYKPYVMIYNKPKAPHKLKQLAGWVNNRIIWQKVANFEDYDPSHRG